MKVSATYLRQNIYKILDQVIESGEPVQIERHGELVELVPIKKTRKIDLSQIPRRDDFIVGDPEDLVHIDWSAEWKPDSF